MSDYRYFKYRLINKNLIASLVNGALYFALPSNLNDPFDCQIDIRKAAKFAASKVTGIRRDVLLTISDLSEFVDEIQRRMTTIGVCSFSLNLEESLQWSHYADEHRGVCLMYEFPEDFLLKPENQIVGVSEVEYGENPLSDWMIQAVPDKIEDDFYDHFTTEILKKVLIVKARGWSYEKECRIIREKAGLFPIPKEFLKQVCFGLDTAESDIQLIQKIVDRSSYCVDYCRIQKLESDFGIRAVEI